MPITVNHLTVYDAERSRPILQDISCTIEQGKITLLLGKTGAGKSTFLDVLSGLAEHSGSIAYDGEPVWQGKRTDRLLRRQIGNVFQYPEQQLFARTVADEFAYSLRFLRLDKTEQETRIAQAMTAMGLSEDLKAAFPFELSGGQKRRVALASTLCTQPRWLFLDEPTAGLDPAAAQLLLAELTARKQAGGGILIATHDLDTLLPLADQAIIMCAGRIFAQVSTQELSERPELLAQAQIGIPDSMELFAALRRAGVEVAAACPIAPERLAQAIVQTIGAGGNAAKPLPIPDVATGSEFGEQQKNRAISRGIPAAADPSAASARPDPRGPGNAGTLAESLDPRAKWLAYMLLSVGIFAQAAWAGLACSAVAVMAVMLASQVPLRKFWPLTKPYLWLLVAATLFSGIGLDEKAGWRVAGHIYFSAQTAAVTLFALTQILFIMLLGMTLTFTTTQLKMKAGLEQSLVFLRRLKLPVEAFSLTASLMLRFIPLIAQEARRFSRIVMARGKRQTRVGAVKATDLGALATPLLISVIHLAADLSFAMEARGYTRTGMKRTSGIALRLKRADLYLLAISGAALLSLIGARLWLPQ